MTSMLPRAIASCSASCQDIDLLRRRRTRAADSDISDFWVQLQYLRNDSAFG
jgi:hypothetical protein